MSGRVISDDDSASGMSNGDEAGSDGSSGSDDLVSGSDLIDGDDQDGSDDLSGEGRGSPYDGSVGSEEDF